VIEMILQKGESLLYIAVTLFLGWVGWSVKTRFVPREEHNKLTDRVAQLETVVKYMPTAREINALRTELSAVSTDLKVYNQRHANTEDGLRRVQVQLDRMDEFLRKGDK
jgi:hypothetical protein